MTKLYKCDGCKDILAVNPVYTIQRTDGISVYQEVGEWHVCSWQCVGLVAREHEGMSDG